MERKEALKLINQKLEQGLKKQEIFKELLSQVKFKSDLVRYIAMVPSPEARKRYKTLNRILFSILIFIAISKLIIGAMLLSQISINLLPIALIIPLFSIYFAVMIWNFYGNMYRVLGMLAIAGILKGLSDLSSFSSYSSMLLFLDFAFGFLPVIMVVFLSYYIGFKAFPYYSFWGRLKEDKLDFHA